MSKILIVVDMQNDFCKPEGVLYNPEAEKIIPNVVERCKQYCSEDVFYTCDSHFPVSYDKTIEGQRIPFHCNANSLDWGWAIEEQVGSVHRDKDTGISSPVLFKDAFAAKEWDYQFKKYESRYGKIIDEVELCGTCTDICVISNALWIRSIRPRVKITVHANCCVGTSEEAHKAALLVMKNCCIDVIED